MDSASVEEIGTRRTRELGPRPLMERVSEGQDSGEVAATAVFVDLAGFTVTADALARHGDHGAEVLAEMIAAVFGPLVDAVYDWGGYVTGFSGDAIMAVFEGPAEHGVAAAHRMAATLGGSGEHLTPYGSFAIRGRVGAGTGRIQWRWRSTPDGRRAVYWFHGEAISAAVAAEGRAQAGTLMLDERLQGIVDVDAEPVSPALPIVGPGTHPLVARVYPPEIHDANNEFRPVVVAFLSIADASRIEAVIDDLFDLQERFGGRATVEVADKGAVIMLVWGAPVAYEGDTERALELLLELRDRHPGLLRTGVSHGVAFAGFAGSPRREEYTVYGSQVNIAARLMGEAEPDEIRVGSAVAARAGADMVVRSIGVHHLKGIAEPVAVHTISHCDDRKATATRTRVLIGREREMAALRQALGPLDEARGAGSVLVVGDAGAGKSHLVEALGAASATRWLTGQSDPVGRRALGPLAWAVSRHLGVSRHASGAVNSQRLDAFITEHPALAEHRPFLAALVEVVDPGPVYEAAEPAARFRGIQAACVALFADLVRSGPIVLRIDDLHWADSETLAFLPTLCDRLADLPFAIVATSRTPGLLAGAQEVPVGPMDEESVATLAADILGEPLAPATATWLTERTGGNPFFVEQILLHLRERAGLIASSDGAVVVEDDALPPTVGDVVVARLDALPASVRHAVQTAAVIGADLSQDVLERVLGGPAGEVCAAAARRDVWDLDGARRIRFRHDLFRDAVYGTLLNANRTVLHARTADAIASVYHDAIEAHLRHLAHHEWNGARPLPAVLDGARAARHALGLGAYREAVDAAHEALERVTAVPESERSEPELVLLLALGAGLIVTAGQSAAPTRAAYERALKLSEFLPEGRERFQALFGLRTYHQFAGDQDASRELADQCLRIAERLSEPDLLMQAHLMVGNTRFWAGELDAAAAHLDEVLRLGAVDHHAAQVSGFAQNPRFTAVVPAAFAAWLRGDASGAASMVESARRDAVELGHRFSEALVLQADGFLHVFEDRPHEAGAAGDALAEIARDEEFPLYIAIAAVVQGWARSRLGDVDGGLGLMRETIEELRARGVVIAQTLLGLLLADGALKAGRRAQGRDAADVAITIAQDTGECAWLGELLRVRAELEDDPATRADLRARALATASAQGARVVVRRINETTGKPGATT